MTHEALLVAGLERLEARDLVAVGTDLSHRELRRAQEFLHHGGLELHGLDADHGGVPAVSHSLDEPEDLMEARAHALDGENPQRAVLRAPEHRGGGPVGAVANGDRKVHAHHHLEVGRRDTRADPRALHAGARGGDELRAELPAEHDRRG